MGQKFSDAARAELLSAITASSTTINLTSGGAKFPVANAGTAAVSDANDWFKVVIQDADAFEIAYVRTHGEASDQFTNVLRGQEGTTARSFAATSVIGVRLTALDMANLWTTMATKAAASHTHAQGDVTGLSTALAAKADDSVTLTDAAGSATLPATAAASVASRLQALRNNVKQAFADLAGKADDTAVVKLTGAQTVAGVKTFTSRSAHAGAYTPSQQPAHSATPTFDCATSNVFEPAALTGNVTSITLANAVAGQTVQIRFQQDATGGRTVAVPSGAKVDGSINTEANRVSWLILTYSSRGSRWEGNWLQVPL